MPASIVAFSDLHLGYDCCVLDDPAVQDRVVEEVTDLCGGATYRLIFNGDCLEGCVPGDAGTHDIAGFSPLMASTVRSFLQKFTDKITTTSLVLLWGNHDYTLWSRLAASCGVPTFTNNMKGDVLLQHDGCILPGADRRCAVPGDLMGDQRPRSLAQRDQQGTGEERRVPGAHEELAGARPEVMPTVPWGSSRTVAEAAPPMVTSTDEVVPCPRSWMR